MQKVLIVDDDPSIHKIAAASRGSWHKPYNMQEFWDVVSGLLGERKARFVVRFWGTKGSIATPGHATVKYGGEDCIELRC